MSNNQIRQHNGKPQQRMNVMTKPIGPACNIDCTYCYYLSKQQLLNYDKGCKPTMNPEYARSLYPHLHRAAKFS
ncbi:hypothetical protein [Moritella marina]|uniref:hypothetical protein n=1 Tax=Moritella marina TaxID=90736 RepID=UPI00370471B2